MSDNNNPFGNLTTDGIEKAGDFLGGGGPLESGVYTGEIKLAFAGKSDGGANFLEVHVDTGNGRMYRERLWVTSGTAKGGHNYYERNGKKSPLPGFTIGNDLALLSTGHELNAQTFEEKVVKLYDFDSKMELPTKVQAATSMMGQQISIGVLKQKVNKNAKDVSGNYVPASNDDGTAATRDENVIDKVFHAETGKTVSEFTGGIEQAKFQGDWLKKNEGQTINKVKPVEGKTGTPGSIPAAGAAKPAAGKSLFG